MHERNKGFTFVEVLVVLSVTAVLLTIAVANLKNFSDQSVDSSAQSDYRNIKLAVLDALTRPDAPARFVVNQLEGPARLPEPLTAIQLSAGVQASILFDSRRRNNNRPQTNTSIEVFHLDGTKAFRLTEVNGTISEQVINR